MCLFELYESKLDKTIKRVKDGKLNESEILPQLTKFKFILKKNCSVLTEDIWDNYKFYAAQRDKIASEYKSKLESEIMQTSFNSTLPTAMAQRPPQPEPKPELQSMTVSPEIMNCSGPNTMSNILNFKPFTTPRVQTTKNSMNNSLNTSNGGIGMKIWMKPGSSRLTPSRPRDQSSASGQKSENRDGSKTERCAYWRNNLRSNDALNKCTQIKTSSRNTKRSGLDQKQPNSYSKHLKAVDTFSNKSFVRGPDLTRSVLHKSVVSNNTNKSDRRRSS